MTAIDCLGALFSGGIIVLMVLMLYWAVRYGD